ncbi:bacteriorhodopsin-like [soil metagenome]
MNTLLAEVLTIKVDDPVAFTFFIGYMAMFASTIFFLFERGSVDGKWKTSLLVSGMITGIAAVHYYYMRDFYMATGTTPTALRYIDWTLTVPLMCVEFYLLLKPAGASKSFMWKLIAASVLMLVMGYVGEAFGDGSMGHSVLYGFLSTLGYIYILYSAWFGEAKQLAASSNSEAVKKGINALAWFVLVGWAIYPIGYMAMPGGWLGPDGAGLLQPSNMDLIYNIGDAVNKIGFGLVVYGIATSETAKASLKRA